MNIVYPTDQEMQQAIEVICVKALKKTVNLATFLRDMACNLGMKYIFYGTYDVVFISVFVFLFAGLCLGNNILFHPMGEAWLYAGVFALAPLLTMLLFSISFWKECETSMYYQKMVCRYTVAHLLAFRMLVASILGFVFITGYVLVVCLITQASFLQVLGVAYASLFLFSIIMTQVVLAKGTFLPLACLNLAWILVNGLACFLSIDLHATLLRIIPTAIWIIVDLALAVLLIRRFCVYVRRVCHAYG